jgi:hypothetical protein
MKEEEKLVEQRGRLGSFRISVLLVSHPNSKIVLGSKLCEGRKL